MSAPPLIEITDPADPRIAEFVSIKERDLTGRQGRFIAEGTVVLTMLARAHLAGGGVRAEKILLLKNRVEGLSALLETFPADVPVYVAEGAVLDAIAGFHLHRGVLAIGKRVEPPALAVQVAALPAHSLVLVGCGISNHDNIGSLFRNAAGFTADAVLLDETCCDPLYRKALRVSVGSVLTIPYSRQGSAEALLGTLAEAGFEIWALSPSGTVEIGEIMPGERVALVMGTEGEGLPASILDRFRSARIAQAAGLDSLNVGTASGIALYHLARTMGRLG
ncbi:RNA methyltransferase [Rhizobium sp. CECT 9324]|uniref:TrmH family RNA methyltransferase n=1 Tax=Rhizobium sp. CECT 9324 TaxID=2845820 RepID=UPI001E62D7FD|nr:RNA methyltransferase [Rhizobium sp. CECT 9324]CAH0341645.1 23S rRNA (guanosine-2'-O-)-methyltransferase RlmB [Rhizobium sp. CECT 9324]